MTLHIELTPEDEAKLRQQAAANGEAPEALAREMLRSLLDTRADQSPSAAPPGARRKSTNPSSPSIRRKKDWRRTVGAVDPASPVERAFEAGRRIREAERSSG